MSVFTIGTEQEYDDAMIHGIGGNGVTPIVKRGKYIQADGTPYNGGYAFATAAEAYAYIDKVGKSGVWAAYELDAVWPDDVWHGNPTDEHMVLKRDAVLLRKVRRPAPIAAPGERPRRDRSGTGIAGMIRALVGRLG
jgi:hypothetical protein